MSDDKHFFVQELANRIPTELLPKKQSWSKLLSAVTQLKVERNNAIMEVIELQDENERLKKTIKDRDYWRSKD